MVDEAHIGKVTATRLDVPAFDLIERCFENLLPPRQFESRLFPPFPRALDRPVGENALRGSSGTYLEAVERLRQLRVELLRRHDRSESMSRNCVTPKDGVTMFNSTVERAKLERVAVTYFENEKR